MTLARSSWYSTVGGWYDTYTTASVAQDDLGAEYVPGAKAWVKLKREVIEIADGLGVGQEVSALFEAFKVGTTLGFHVAATGSTGAVAALSITAGVSAGVLGGAVVALVAIFGGDSDEPTVAKQRRDAIRATLWKVLLKPTSASLAAEQDDIADKSDAQAKALGAFSSTAPYQAQALSVAKYARKLATFYRLADDTLSSSETALFLSAIWVARLVALRDAVANFSTGMGGINGGYGILSQKQEVEIAFPGLAQEIDKRVQVASAEFSALSKKKTVPKTNSGVASAIGYGALALGVGAASLYLFKPALATRLAGQGLGLARSGASQVGGAVKDAASATVTGAKRLVKGRL